MNIVLFTQNRWAFGNIHHSLAKYLYQHKIYAEVVDFTVSYKQDEFVLLNEWADFFITNPDAVQPLQSYNIPSEKIIAVAHARWDIQRALHQDPSIFDNVKEYCVVSKYLQEFSKQIGIRRNPLYLPVGIFTDKYFFDNFENNSEFVVGYAGAFVSQNWEGKEIKRGYLVERIVNELKTEGYSISFRPHNFYMWQSMPAYYRYINALLVTSTEEGAGLPFMEALAAGKHVITTDVGYVREDPYFFNFKVEVNDDIEKTVTDFKECLKTLLECSCEKRKKMSEYNRFISRYYDWEHRGKYWSDFLLNLK